MLRFPMRLPFLLAALLAPVVQAQAPRVLNAQSLPPAEEEQSASSGALIDRRGPTPDTTAPWRYYPLAVGNAWEYRRFPTGLPHIDLGTIRIDIEKDTLVNGTRYFIHSVREYDEFGNPHPLNPQRTPIRFDTLTASVVGPTAGGGEGLFEDCPFDAPFDAVVMCGPYGKQPFYVYGGYDAATLTFPDTSLTVTYKAYSSSLGFETHFAPGYGRFLLWYDNGNTLVLDYVRVGEEEYGGALYPLAGEPPKPQEEGLPQLAVWPNPFRGTSTIVLALPEAGRVEASVYDVLGRRVAVLHKGPLGAGRHEVALDGRALPAGVYVVRVALGPVVLVRRVTVVR